MALSIMCALVLLAITSIWSPANAQNCAGQNQDGCYFDAADGGAKTGFLHCNAPGLCDPSQSCVRIEDCGAYVQQMTDGGYTIGAQDYNTYTVEISCDDGQRAQINVGVWAISGIRDRDGNNVGTIHCDESVISGYVGAKRLQTTSDDSGLGLNGDEDNK